MKFTMEQENFLNQYWDGTELCPYCDVETDFKFNPIKDKFITCKNCGKRIYPCSLCDCGKYCDSCSDRIKASLLHFNELWDETFNGKY